MKLKAHTVLEVHMISTLIQESITCGQWIDLKDDTVKILLNRFCWEKNHDPDINYRVNSDLRIGNIKSAQIKKKKLHPWFKYLLGIKCLSSNKLNLIFSDGNELLLTVDNIDIKLEDISPLWTTDKKPRLNNFNG